MIQARYIVIIICLSAYANCAIATHLPLWEWGVGIGSIHAPLYRGSKIRKDYYLPIPYVKYRGELFKSDEDGTRTDLVINKRLILKLSIAGNIPVPNSKNGARANMPSLDAVIELGPSLKYRIWDSKNKKHTLSAELPTRAVFSLGSPFFEHQGWVISPFINWRTKIREKSERWRFSFSLGPIFADDRYHNYFYEVNQKFITPNRREYHANSGYSGSRSTMSISRTSRHLFLGLFARLDSLEGATFRDSPLVETNTYFFAGIAMSWIFSHSDERVKHPER